LAEIGDLGSLDVDLLLLQVECLGQRGELLAQRGDLLIQEAYPLQGCRPIRLDGGLLAAALGDGPLQLGDPLCLAGDLRQAGLRALAGLRQIGVEPRRAGEGCLQRLGQPLTLGIRRTGGLRDVGKLALQLRLHLLQRLDITLQGGKLT
jgi:hypothetical protein